MKNKFFLSIILGCILLILCACVHEEFQIVPTITEKPTVISSFPFATENKSIATSKPETFPITIRDVELPLKAEGVLLPYIDVDGEVAYRNVDGSVHVLESALALFKNGYLVVCGFGEIRVTNANGERLSVSCAENEHLRRITEREGRNYIELVSPSAKNFEICEVLGNGYLIRSEGKRYIIDITGKVLVSCEHENYYSLTNDIVLGLTYGSEHLLDKKILIDLRTGESINVDGKYAIFDSPVDDLRVSYEDGLIWFIYYLEDGSEAGMGYMNMKGEIVLSPIFRLAEHFSEGMAAVIFDSVDKGFSYIDVEGNLAFEEHFAWARPFSEGLAAVSFDGEKYGYIDKTGKFVIEPVYCRDALDGPLWEKFEDYVDKLSMFHKCYAMLASAEEGWPAYLDMTGKEVFRFSVPVSTEE